MLAQAWLSGVALAALAVSLGRFASPLWWARWLPIAGLGPHAPANLESRGDAYLDDGTGSLYAILAMLLPGFHAFRYPVKFLTFFAAALAALAGAGWDRVLAGRSQRLRRLGWVGLGASLLGLALLISFIP